MITNSSAARQLRCLLDGERLVVAAGAGSPLAAKLVERAGFPVVYMTGNGTALVRYGLPDVGLLTQTEMVESARAMAQVVSLPVIADADTGYGNELNVRRTVREYERAGVAGLHIEDQVMPKKCGHLRGKRLISLEEMASKVRAACDARLDPDFVIIARCDALAVSGLEDAVARCRAYRAAGADAIFVESPTTMEQLETIPHAVDAPTVLNLSSSRKTPYLSNRELEELGYRIAIFPNFTTLASIRAMEALLQDFKASGDIRSVVDRCVSFGELMDVAGLGEVQELEHRYGFSSETLTAI